MVYLTPMTPILEIGLIIILSTILGYFARVLKQPVIIAYIIAGFILGPFGLALITSKNEIMALSELGIAFLLFVVGLELNFGKLKRVGKEILFVSILQVGLTFFFTFGIFIWFGFEFIVSLYLGLATSFSSTMVVIKLLSDRKKIDSLRGRLTVGILIIQDILIIIVLSMVPNLEILSTNLVPILMNGIGLISLAIVLNRFVFPPLLKHSAKTRELFFLLSLSTVFLFITISYYLGFSIAIGGFIAGLTLATYPYNIEIVSEVRPMHNFFLAIFFASLGMQIYPQLIQTFLLTIVILFLIVLIIKPLIILGGLRIFKYESRIPIVVAIPLAQASEFTFILIQQGYKVGHLSFEFASLITTFTLLSIAITPYLFTLSYKVADRVAKRKTKIKRKKLRGQVLILGCHKAGKYLVENLKEKVIIVDHDPDVIEDLKERGYHCVYGEGDNRDILEAIGAGDAKLVISTIPDLEANLYITRVVKDINREVTVIAKAFTIPDALRIYEEGADYVVIPMRLAGEKILKETNKILQSKDLKKMREREIKRLREEIAEGFLV